MKNAIRYSLAFWIAFYLAILFLLLPVGTFETVSLRVFSFVIPQMILFYSNLLILLPKQFHKGKKKQYFFRLIVLIGLFTVVFGYLDLYFDKVIPLEMKHLSDRPISFVYFGRAMSCVPPLLISALIYNSILLQRKTKESLELQNKMLAAETSALKAQINPHFLFNTLNNIYSLSQLDSSKTGGAILQLSDILRYVTYESNQKYVALTAEIEHIKSFIKLQLLKDDNCENLDIEIESINSQLQIAPLILIPFIENAFKHGNHHDKDNGWIKIVIKLNSKTLLLSVSNSTSEKKTQKDKVGGVGMENVRKRLSLLYPETHKLTIKINPNSYVADLEIKLTE